MASAAPGDACSNEEILKAGCSNSDLAQLESDTVQSYLALHGLPATDSTLVYTLGRTDLRDEIRALMFARIREIIAKQAQGAALTAHQTAIYNWFRDVVWTYEKNLYAHAVADRDSWTQDPCSWKPDPDIASATGLVYNRPENCNPSSLVTLTDIAPGVPTKNYFLAAALKSVYGAPLLAAPQGLQIIQDMTARSALIYGASALTTVAVAGLGPLVPSFVYLGELYGFAGAGFGTSALYVAGPGILVAAIVSIIVGSIEVAKDQETLHSLQDLDNDKSRAMNTPPDLNAMSRDAQGLFKFGAAFAAQTLPEFSSTAALPSHGANDATFQITDASAGNAVNGSTTLGFLDWSNYAWNITTYYGYFAGNATINGAPVTSFSPTIQYQDWSGAPYIASRLANGIFLVTKNKPAPTDVACAPDPVSGVTALSDVSGCLSYLSYSLKMLGASGHHLTVSLASAPVFNTVLNAVFTESGSIQNFDFYASGAPLPIVTFAAAPDALQFNPVASTNSGMSAGHGRLQYFGGLSKTHHPGTYTATVTASNASGSVTQTMNILVGDAPAFSGTTNFADFFNGVPGSFTVTAAGYPTPAIYMPGPATLGRESQSAAMASRVGRAAAEVNTPNSLPLPSGITFRDNHDGTATLSGTASGCNTTDSPLIGGDGTSVAPLLYSSYVDAQNSLGTVETGLGIGSFCSSPASVTGPSDVTFRAGQSNTAIFGGSSLFRKHTWVNDRWVYSYFPAKVTFSCQFPSGLSFLSCSDDGSGGLALRGTPPLSSTGLNQAILVKAHAPGSLSDLPATSVLVSIAPAPIFGKLDDLFFQYGGLGSTHTFIPSTPDTSYTITGTLPASVTYSTSGALTISYDGSSSVASTGGYFPVVVNATNSYGSQSFPMNIYIDAAPKIVSSSLATFSAGAANHFEVQTSGFPKAPVRSTSGLAGLADGMIIGVAGALPQGVVFSGVSGTGSPDGVGFFSGTPCSSCAGTYPLTITAKNIAGSQTQSFSLKVLPNGAPLPSPNVTWSNPAAISYGQPLSATQLNATADVPGSFTWSPALGAVLDAGTYTLQAVFTPTDTANYSATTKTVSLTVNKAIPVVDWPGTAPLQVGTAYSTVNVISASSPVPGSFTYSPPFGTVPPVGAHQEVDLTFSPTDAANYATVAMTEYVDVVAPPVPAPVLISTPLSPSNTSAASFQFSDADSTAHFQCSLDSNPPRGCSSGQSYSVPAGAHTFSVIALNSQGQVGPAATYNWTVLPSLKVAATLASKTAFDGGGNITLTLTLTNSGTINAQNVQLTSLALKTLTGAGTMTNLTTLPVTLGTLLPGSPQTVTLNLKESALGSVSRFSATVGGSYSDGTANTALSAGFTVIP